MSNQIPSKKFFRNRSIRRTSKLLGIGLIFAILWEFPGCQTTYNKPLDDLIVTSFAPEPGKTDTPNLRFQFNQPVVKEDALGKILKKAPASLEPSVPLSAYWEDRQTLIVVPEKDLKPSTSYQIHFRNPLGDKVTKKTFSFVHKALAIKSLEGIDLSNISTEPTITVRFNQKIEASKVIKACRLEHLKSKEKIALTSVEDEAKKTRIIVKPVSLLEQDQGYEFICDQLTKSTDPSAEKIVFRKLLHTYPTLAITSFSPKGTSIAADEVAIEIEFSNPVTLGEVQKTLQSTPKINGLTNGWLNYDGTRYFVELSLTPQTKYQITVENLKDIYQQPLKTQKAFSFTTGDARPRLQVEKGIYALEADNQGYPVWTRNIDSFDLECARIEKKNLVQLLTSEMNYDPWYEDAKKDLIDWKRYKITPKEHTIKTKVAKNKWKLSQLLLHDYCGGTQDRGVFLVELRSKDLKPDKDKPWRHKPKQRVLANVTDLGVLLKAGASSGLVWVTRLSSGKPVQSAKVSVYTPKGKLVNTGYTDTDGMLKLPGAATLLEKQSNGAEEWEFGYRSQRLIVTVEKDTDMAVVDGNWSNGIQIWNFGVEEDRRHSATYIRGFIQSDRGIYRPGETVHFKGLAREVSMGKTPKTPKNDSVDIVVEDGRGTEIYRDSLPLSSYGGFSFSLDLFEEASLGDYYVSATIGGQKFRERFFVEEFRKVSYELSIESEQPSHQAGDTIDMTLHANYLFGAPVTQAKVDWTVQRRDYHVSFPKFPQYSFADYSAMGSSYWWYDYQDYQPVSFTSDGVGTSDQNGKFQFSIRDPQKRFDKPQTYLIQATVTNEADETVSKHTSMVAHRSEFYVGLHAQEYVQAVDMPFAVNTVAITPEGKPIAAKATLRLLRQRYICNYRTGSYEPCERKQEEIWSRDVKLPAKGTGTERILPKDPGQFVIQLESEDKKGNKVIASTYVWVIGKGEAFWSGDESARMSLIPSKHAYKTGEIARLVPQTSLPKATALVTLERDGIIDAWVKELDTTGEGIEVPIQSEHAPNIFASVTLVNGRSGKGDQNRPRFQMGVTSLNIPATEKQLEVQISTEEKSYEPGQEVVGTILVTQDGKPVDAEVSLSVADEGALQLIAYKTPDPMKTFYAPFGLGVDNGTNWNRIARQYDPSQGFPEAGGDAGDGDGSGIRSRFVSSAFWAPSLYTDASGEIEFRFIAPDNLSAFRLMAVAADKTAQFGSGEGRITIKKPLLAVPTLPRFLQIGDKASVGVVIHNYTDVDGFATVQASAKGALLSTQEKKVRLTPGGKARVRFESVAQDTKLASFTFQVSMQDFQDALQVEIPVDRPKIIETHTLSQGESKKDFRVPFSWDTSILAEDSFLEISVDRTGLGELQGSLEYLIEYPYGCLEQTLSRFIPLTKVKDLASSLALSDLQGKKVEKFIQAGVLKVLRHQSYNGFFSLWPGGTTYPHLSVYAMFGLTEARQAGISVDAEAMKKGAKAISRWVNDKSRSVKTGGESATMAMGAYVLAYMGQPDHGLNARLFSLRKSLPVYGQAFLLKALHLAKTSLTEQKTLRKELEAQIQRSGDTAMIQEVHISSYRWYMSSDVRSTAITLSALLLTTPKHSMIPALAKGLKSKMKPGGYWRNTQDNLYALIALSDYARQQSNGSANVTLSNEGKTLLSQELNGGEILRFQESLQTLKQGELSLKTDGPVHYSMRMVLAYEDKGKLAKDQGFAIERSYVDPKTGKPIKSFQVGQLIKVKVQIKTDEERYWVALVDPIPAGFEAVNTRLATTQQNTSTSRGSYRFYWTHRELRDDRVTAFADLMRKGTHRLEYLVRAGTAGSFNAAPSFIEAMYEPEIYGRGTSEQIEIDSK